MHKIRVGVVRGGPSSEYDISLKTGASVLKHLSPEKYLAKDILIDHKGNWHVNGIPTLPHKALEHVDVVFNALHGHYGEDGKIQHIFESHGIPFTGSGSFSSAVGMNKAIAKGVYKKEKIKTPEWKLIEQLQDVSKQANKVFKSFPPPVIVKPSSNGSSFGKSLVKNISEFETAVKKAFEYSNAVLVEEFIQGKEVSCGVIENYRDKDYYTLLPVEVKSEVKISPANISEKDKIDIESLTIKAHRALGLSHYSNSDFIIHPKRGVFILETDSQPPITEESHLVTALKAVGAPLNHFLEHIISLAITRK